MLEGQAVVAMVVAVVAGQLLSLAAWLPYNGGSIASHLTAVSMAFTHVPHIVMKS